MNNKKLLILMVSICLASILTTLSFATGCAKPAPKEPIKIGALCALTGLIAHLGPKCQAGIEFRLDEAGWEVAGRPIELIVEDDKGMDPVVALDKARKLVEFDKVHFTIGPLDGIARNAVEPYFEEHKMPNFPAYHHLRESKELDWIFLHMGILDMVGWPMGYYAYDKMGYRTAITIGSDYVVGRRFIKGFTDAFKERGGTIIQQVWPPFAAPDYAPFLATLKDADVVVAWLGAPGIFRYSPTSQP